MSIMCTALNCIFETWKVQNPRVELETPKLISSNTPSVQMPPERRRIPEWLFLL